jgi:uncharacterized protein (DUF1810 family)
MGGSSDIHDLERFVAAQAPVIDRVRDELRHGDKKSHWMWFVFPQIAGLGHSAMAQHYAVSGLDEARAYLAHPVLGPRLIECTRLVGVSGRSISAIFGSPDDMKFKSAMTLFAAAQPGPSVFQGAIDRYFGGKGDEATVARL